MQKIDSFRVSCLGEVSLGIWESDTYLCCAFRQGEAIRLDIQRKDEKDGIGWDELQEIKRGCGFGSLDAIEFYPADMDVINTGNWRHLYVFDAPLPLIIRGFNSTTKEIDHAG